MDLLRQALNYIAIWFSSDIENECEIIAMIMCVAIMSTYEYLIYRIVSKKTLYNKNFHMSLLIIPYFIAAIIKALNSNLIITLGTIGALAIIRYRTAIKDPIDMMYLLWSIFIGIVCGSNLIKLGLLVSIAATIVLLLSEFLFNRIFKKQFCLIVNSRQDIEESLEKIVKEETLAYKLKSTNYSINEYDYIFEIKLKNKEKLLSKIVNLGQDIKYSLVEYDNEDAI